jgi:hypothetical protein
LEHFHVKPFIIGSDLYTENKKRMGHKGHRYDATQDNDAGASASALRTSIAVKWLFLPVVALILLVKVAAGIS